MKRFIVYIMAFLIVMSPYKARAINDGFDIVAESNKEDITLYAKRMNGLYYSFKLDFKGTVYSRPFWISVANNPAFAPQVIYEDINQDKKKELIVILNKGYGTGVSLEDAYVFETDSNRFSEVLVDNPQAIILKNAKTSLTPIEAQITIGESQNVIDISPVGFKPENIFNDISFGSITTYEVVNNQLIVKLAAQVSPAHFIGEVIITYEYRDKMYQAKSIEFKEYHF
ncbi:hypothetical protein [Bacillus suaedaesalsae]|uniref:Uncharacterized protein n=1 Tax=Bacillus suaedaesalsae TaxID=2810349 RepID=A0ABS2DI02_9BACI|nr:hypothetical protein [Bacillus suaedaesalsae]MBM6618078.1 hypothetical protein [Bacillus suaedaesalsae]